MNGSFINNSVNFYNKKKFNILADQKHTVHTYKPNSVFEMTLHPKVVARFRAGESTPAFNGFYFAAVSDSGLAAHPSIYYSYEIYFEG